MMLGSFLTGFLGDRYGRRFTYQANLIILGLTSLASVFAPTMPVLILLRGVMGVGLGAELVARATPQWPSSCLPRRVAAGAAS